MEVLFLKKPNVLDLINFDFDLLHRGSKPGISKGLFIQFDNKCYTEAIKEL